MITTCLWHRWWFCICGIVLCLQLPRHIGAKHIYLRHSPRRRVTVLRSCYIMFQVGNCVHCTKAVRCHTASVRELRDKIRGKRLIFFFVFRYITESHGASVGGQVKKKKKEKNASQYWLHSEYLCSFEKFSYLIPLSSIRTESSKTGLQKCFLKFQRQFWCTAKVEMHRITKSIQSFALKKLFLKNLLFLEV